MTCGCNSVQAGGKGHGRKKRGGFDLNWLTRSQANDGQTQPYMGSQPSWFDKVGQSFSNLRSKAGEQFNNATRKLGSYSNSQSSDYISPSYNSGSSLPSYSSMSYSRGGRRSRGGRKSRGGKKSKGGSHTRKHRKHRKH